MAAALRRVGVVGAGSMGSGILVVAAQLASMERVLLFDTREEATRSALAYADKHYARAVEKGRLRQDEREAALGRIAVSTSLAELASHSEFIVEAASERPDLKLEIFKSLDESAPASSILASNTSSVSITKIAAATKRPENVIGMHFFNPVPVMKLVEVIPGLATSEATLNVTVELAESLGKTVARAADSPGFISNRLLMPYINEAILAFAEGIGTKDDIDTVMKLGTAVPMGPLTLADFIGLDTCLFILRVLHSDLGLDKFAPAPLLVRYVDAGWLGKKSGRGFYQYDENGVKID
jgi:3-hydroxybutyryl-CoA dehydrogenase